MDAQNTSAIAVDRLVKRYKGVAAVDGISFRLAPGSITGLLGGNGAGKTTTIAMIMGLVMPTSGTRQRARRRDAARALSRAAPDEFREPLCRPADAAHRAAEPDGVRAALRLSPTSPARIAELAAELDLSEFLDRPTGKLSAGQKTRVSLAKALLNEPEVLLLDEPTASLDPDTADWVRAQLEHYRREHGATMLLASHNMGEVERLCERVIIMKTGRIEDDDTPARLLAALRPRDAGGGVPRRRARPRRAARPRNERDRRPRIAFSAAASPRWCCAIGICCARPGRACSS